jgi:hypothetical protein
MLLEFIDRIEIWRLRETKFGCVFGRNKNNKRHLFLQWGFQVEKAEVVQLTKQRVPSIRCG